MKIKSVKNLVKSLNNSLGDQASVVHEITCEDILCRSTSLQDIIVTSGGPNPITVGDEPATIRIIWSEGTLTVSDVTAFAEQRRFVHFNALVLLSPGSISSTVRTKARMLGILIMPRHKIAEFSLTNFFEFPICVTKTETEVLSTMILLTDQSADISVDIEQLYIENKDSIKVLITDYFYSITNDEENLSRTGNIIHALPCPNPGRSLFKKAVFHFRKETPLYNESGHVVFFARSITTVNTVHRRAVRDEIKSYKGTLIAPSMEIVNDSGNFKSRNAIRLLDVNAIGYLDNLRIGHDKMFNPTEDSEAIITEGFALIYSEFKAKPEVTSNDVANVTVSLRERCRMLLTESATRSDQWFIRARKADSVTAEQKLNRKAFSHPPPESTSQLRANTAGHPVFYAADSEEVAVSEINATVGDKVYVSSWTTDEREIRYTRFLFGSNLIAEHLVRELNNSNDRLQQVKSACGDKVYSAIEASFKGMSKLFLDDSHQVSSAIGHDQLYIQGVDAIEFPDVKTGKSFNYAIHPVYSKTLRLHRIKHVEILENSWSTLEVGDVSGDRIVWRKPATAGDHELLPTNLQRRATRIES